MIGRSGAHCCRPHVFAYFKHEETPEGALYAVELLRKAEVWWRRSKLRLHEKRKNPMEGR